MKQIIDTIRNEMIDYYAADPKRVFHFIKVHAFAKQIAEAEQMDPDTRLIIELAALLHDVGIKTSEEKYQSSSGHYQQIEGPPIAMEMMQNHDLRDDIIERVCYLISKHHTYRDVEGIDLQILIEADFLVNLHEDNCNVDQIRRVMEKYFKTTTGEKLCKAIFLGTKA